MKWNSRVNNYKKFEKEMLATEGVVLWTVEAALPSNGFQVTTCDNPRHIQLTAKHVMWDKEAMINVGIKNLPPEAKYVAWIDADVTFYRKDWVTATIQALQTFNIIQPWEENSDMGPGGGMYRKVTSFGHWFQNGNRLAEVVHASRHCGYAWAARREVLDEIGGLLDLACIGGGDFIMVYRMTGIPNINIREDFHPGFKKAISDWGDKARLVVADKLGYIDGTIGHYWHGNHQNRKYMPRWEVLAKLQFDPLTQVERLPNGLLAFTDGGLLEADIVSYLGSRNEDSLSING
jgi:hypothetical protein